MRMRVRSMAVVSLPSPFGSSDEIAEFFLVLFLPNHHETQLFGLQEPGGKSGDLFLRHTVDFLKVLGNRAYFRIEESLLPIEMSALFTVFERECDFAFEVFFRAVQLLGGD